MLALVYPAVISLVPTPAPQTTSFGCSRRAALATGLATSLAALPAPSLASGEDTAGNFMKEGSQTGASSPSTKIGASGLKDTLYGIALGDSPSGDVIDLMWFADANTGAHQLLRRAAGHLVPTPAPSRPAAAATRCISVLMLVNCSPCSARCACSAASISSSTHLTTPLQSRAPHTNPTPTRALTARRRRGGCSKELQQVRPIHAAVVLRTHCAKRPQSATLRPLRYRRHLQR